jgi:tetratricopeptide (TPR) repeat protein
MIRRLFILFLISIPIVSFAQSDRQYIRSGNQLYRKQNYANAEVAYRKAISSNSKNPQALYNLGCALMSQQKDSIAIVQFQKASQIETSSSRKAKIFHNIGVVCQRHQIYGDAIKAYEESLRNNPNDNETRYNLALCKRLQKNQKGGSNSKNNKKKNNNNKKNNSKQNKDKDEKNSKDNQQKQRQPKDQMSKDNAEQLLNAAVQEENDTQKRLKKAMQQPKSRNLEKNW